MLGLQNEREWRVFCEVVLERPALAEDERFAANFKRSAAREALRQIIVEVFATLSAAQIVLRLEKAGIANAQVNELKDVWDHPQLAARRRWRDIQTPAGTVPALLPPGSSVEAPPRMDAVPALGAHTEAILAELGCSPADLAALRSRGAV